MYWARSFTATMLVTNTGRWTLTVDELPRGGWHWNVKRTPEGRPYEDAKTPVAYDTAATQEEAMAAAIAVYEAESGRAALGVKV